MKGIDVSKWQGNIDWNKVKSSNVQFVMIRAGIGMYEHQIDPKFHNNMKGAIQIGIPIGIYWYSYAVNTYEAKKEANACLKIISQYKNNITFPVFFDQEYEPDIQSLSKQLRTDICITFMNEIKKSGYKTGLYCSYDWIKNYLYENQLKNYDKWIAQYNVSQCSYKGNDLAIWQYSAKGKINGINGDVDMNIGYKNYTSTSGSWKKNNIGWWYEYSDGSYPVNQWKLIDNRWYWFDSRGYCVKGYHTINGKKYYFAEQYAFDGYVKECQLIMTTENGDVK